ncbi:hypothetical protein IG631_16958 [Alternaria alternata]|nr:hypothetical protein IG631_16958 [Alternaria alternata]
MAAAAAWQAGMATPQAGALLVVWQAAIAAVNVDHYSNAHRSTQPYSSPAHTNIIANKLKRVANLHTSRFQYSRFLSIDPIHAIREHRPTYRNE